MGQKVNPIGLRLGLVEDWRSRWFASKEYPKFIAEDILIRKHIGKKLKRAGISRIEIERTSDNVKVDIYTARPGIVIGRKGSEVDVLRSEIAKIVGKQVQINIQEITRPELDATIVAQRVAEQIEARVSFRRAMKKAVASAVRDGAKGFKISCTGRLGGSEMARNEWYREGRVPLHTLRAVIDYGFAQALTTVGLIGIKVWIYKGDVVPGLVSKVEEKVVEKPAKTKKLEETQEKLTEIVLEEAPAKEKQPLKTEVEKPKRKAKEVIDSKPETEKKELKEKTEKKETRKKAVKKEPAENRPEDDQPLAEKSEAKKETVAKTTKTAKTEKKPKAKKEEASKED